MTMARTPNKTEEQIEQELETFADKTEEKQPEGKKDFFIKHYPSGLYYIALTGGGEVPDGLKGSFTTIRIAQQFIDEFKKKQQLAEASG